MAQFDVYRLRNGTLVVDLQTDLIGLDVTRIVAPLRDQNRYPAFPNLTPLVAFEGTSYIVQVQDLASLERQFIGPSVGNLEHYQHDLLRALDILTRGF